MKAQILKIAGVKSEKEFYKKFPSEEAFMKKHGKEFKKAERGIKVDKFQFAPYPISGGTTNTPKIFPSAQNPAPSFNPFGGYQNLLDYSKTLTNPNAPTAKQANAARNVVTPYSPDYKGPIDPNAVKAQVTKAAPEKGLPFDAVPVVGGLIKGIEKLGKEKEARLKSQQEHDEIKVMSMAAKSRDVNPVKHVIDRPEDYAFDTASFFPKYGGRQFGVNALSAEDGAMIGGNETEIQNTYNPGDLYSDLGYTPLNNIDQVKQYYGGGKLTKANFGSFMKSAQSVGTTGVGGDVMKAVGPYGGSLGNLMGGGDFESNAGSDIGGAIGGVFGPVGGFIGSFAGGLLDKSAGEIKGYKQGTQRMMGDMMGAQMGQQNRSQFGLGVAEDGGWVSHDWQPQVITKFGDVDVSQIHNIATEGMDTLRTGGRITQNNMFPQDQYAMGGELKTTWGGYAEPISKNPYDESETVMFRGKSHSESDGNGHTGIGVKYGEGQHDDYTDYAEYGTEQADADVEVQRNEPAKKINGDLIVAGGIKTSKEAAAIAGNPKFAGKKYQTNIADIARKDAKLNKQKDKVVEQVNSHKDDTPFGKLALKTNSLILDGIDKQQQINNYQSTALLDYQNAINETADNLSELHGKKVDPNFLEKGKIKFEKESGQAKYGKAIEKAQKGKEYKVKGDSEHISYNPIGEAGSDELWGSKEKYEKNWKPKVSEALSDPARAKQIVAELENYKGESAQAVIKAIKNQKTLAGKIAKIEELGTDEKVGPYHNLLNKTIDKVIPTQTTTTPQTTPLPDVTVTGTRKKSTTTGTTTTIFPYKRNQFMDIINQALPYLRPSDAEALSPYQVMGELSVMGEQPEGVQARLIQPDLDVPYNISYQDQLNEITAQARAAERMGGQDPAAAAAILGQAARMKSAIKGQEFIANQAQRMGVYDRNRAVLNQAKLQNLGIADQQYTRQSQANSVTKATKLAAQQSMASKYLQNQLANRKLKTAENLYNYRFDPNFRAINMNPLAQFNYSGSGKTTGGGIDPNLEFTYNSSGNIVGTRRRAKDDTDETGKYGKSVKKKINPNSLVVKSLKNI